MTKTKKITFIGDVHGHIDEYLKLVRDCEYSIQLGDMGFDYSRLLDIDTNRHRFVPGNHEQYSQLFQLARDRWNFPFGAAGKEGLNKEGVLSGHGSSQLADMELFYIRGGFSIDKNMRSPGRDWFPEEEMTHDELRYLSWRFESAMTRVIPEKRPGFIVSHECPAFLVSDYDYLRKGDIWKYFCRSYQPSRTALAMEAAWHSIEIKPAIWVFAHHHVAMDEVIEGTRFICLPELETIELEF
jgi:hypothetical protein